ITFTRGAGNAIDCTVNPLFGIEWQRIDFGPHANVQTRQVTLMPGQGNVGVMITAVDMTRAFALTSGMPNGNGGGESNWFGNYSGAEAMVRVQLTSPMQVTLQRQRTNST